MGKLIEVVQRNNIQAVKKLLTGEYQSINVNAEFKAEGKAALELAVHGKYIEIIRLLLKAGIKETELVYEAINRGNVEAIQTLTKGGADIDQAGTSIFKASSAAMIQALLQGGARVDSLDESNWTPLFRAIQKGPVEVIQALLKGGAKVNQPKGDGATPLHVAVFNSHLEAIRVLLKEGADVNQGNINSGATPLHIAVSCKIEVIEILLEGGANINEPNKNGATPLFVATEKNKVETVQILLKRGAKVDLADKNGWTPLHMAASYHKKIVAVQKFNVMSSPQMDLKAKKADNLAPNLFIITSLLEAGAKLNQPNNDGETPLYIAVQMNDIKTTKFLLAQGADVNCKARNGMSPLNIANQGGYSELALVLMRHASTATEKKGNQGNLLKKEQQTASFGKVIQDGSPVKTESSTSQSHKTEKHSSLIEDKQKAKLPVNLPPTAINKEIVKNVSLLQKKETNIEFSFTLKYNELIMGKELGKGAFGVVYQGTWKKHIEVAIKQLHLAKPSEESLQEFKQEMEIMSRLHCPQVIQLYGVYTTPSYGIVMEYMPNGSLYTVLHSKQPLEWSVRTSIAVDITKGVAFLHSENILHRDLKSLNVLLDKHMNAKLTDFGLAKVKTETASISSSNNNQVAGTLLWMAPELFKRRAQCTQKSDIYSLGMTLWELASRKRPFEDATNSSIAAQWIQQGEREEIPKDCPSKVNKLITVCWDAEASKRPTADEAVKQLLSAELKQEQAESANFSYRGNFDSGIR